MTLGDRFLPGRPAEFIAGDPFWPMVPEGVVAYYARELTSPGSLILIPFCLSPLLPLELLNSGYKVIASNFNPLAILPLKALHGRWEEFSPALTRLMDAPRGEKLLRYYLQSLYQVECPGCGENVEADFFLWEKKAPVAKALKCSRCGTQGTFPLAPKDLKPLENLKEKGPDYWYVLGRLFPPGEISPPEAEDLPLVYTPRNLHCLNALFVKIETLFPEKSFQSLALKTALLVAMHQSLSLYPSPELKRKPTRLHPPQNFVEINAWKAFRAAAESLRRFFRPLPLAEPEEFFGKEKQPALLLSPWGIKRLEKEVPPASASLLLIEPPPLDRTWWALNFLWAGWLMGSSAAQPLRPLALKRAFGWDWYEETMKQSLIKLKGLLKPGGFALILGQDILYVMAECLILAGIRAGLHPESFSFREKDKKLEVQLIFSNPRVGKVETPAIVKRIEEILEEAILEILEYCGEPLSLPSLRLALEWWMSSRKAWNWSDLKREEFRNLLEKTIASLKEMNKVKPWADEALLGLHGYSPLHNPLSDRAELEVYRLLWEKGFLTFLELETHFYERFPGPLVPEANFLKECLNSYGQEEKNGWRLRLEDEPERREKDKEEVMSILRELGEKLGFEVREGSRTPFDLIWEEKAVFGELPRVIVSPSFGFLVESTAALTGLFLRHFTPPFPRSYVVIPGGRAALVWYKLKNMPLWSSLKGWQFIKYRHLRRLAQEKTPDRYSLQKIIGLDPVVERPGAQLSFL
ncbi:MAG: hypothetical protein RMK30_03155 [Anaerolineae bacterium]|nr:hypothetical protein [Anaerolineae bacterium]MDW8101854.1 hypothetical protein [Anaerolineae bacterium]